MILARRPVPQVAAPPSTRTRTLYDDDSRISDPAEVEEVDRSGSGSQQHDGVWGCGGVDSPRALSFAEPHVKGRENEREKRCIFYVNLPVLGITIYRCPRGGKCLNQAMWD